MNSKIYLVFLLIAFFELISSRTITTSDLEAALSEANPGDTILLKLGQYYRVPYRLKNGTEGKPITIKSAPNAPVTFSGTSTKCIFEADYIHDVVIEGPMVLQNALCGLKMLNSRNVNITGLSISNVKREAILMSGHNIHIYKNAIDLCVKENEKTAKTKASGWNQCVSIIGLGDKDFSTNILVEGNLISHSYGESLRFSRCENCKVYQNQMIDGLSSLILLEASKLIEIFNNTLRVSSNSYNNMFGKASGIGMTPDLRVSNILGIFIENNVIIGTKIGIHFYLNEKSGGYGEIRILHNTLWNIEETPVVFQKPNYNSYECIMINNFFYFNRAGEFEPKTIWELGYNYFYNTETVPNIYSDSTFNRGTSKAVKNADLRAFFNQTSDCKDYYNPFVKIECFRPGQELFHSGYLIRFEVPFDFEGCERALNTPSIGAFEKPEGCEKEKEIEPPIIDYDVNFTLNFCPYVGAVMKVVTSKSGWSVKNSPDMTEIVNCWWHLLVKDGTTQKFSYKFMRFSTITEEERWEADPIREFDGKALAKLVSKSTTGEYERCNYTLSGNVINYICKWQ